MNTTAEDSELSPVVPHIDENNNSQDAYHKNSLYWAYGIVYLMNIIYQTRLN